MFHTPKNVMALYLTTAVAVASQPALSAMFTADSFGPNSQIVTFGNSLVDAADSGDNAMLKALLKSGESPDQRGDFQTTALLRAAYRGNLETIKILLLAGANPNLADIGGATPLHVASREGNSDAVDLLLKSGATINIADSEGFTPLMRATMNNEQTVFNDLLDKGADIAVKNEFGESVVEQAAKTKNADMVNKLLAMEELSPKLPLQVADISPRDAKADAHISELTPAAGWAAAVSSQLFGNDHMLTSVADSKGSFNMLDFGSYKSEDEAKKKLEELKAKHADTLKGLNVVVVEKKSGDNTAYHINAGLLDTKEQAVERCKSLVSKGVTCRPVETRMMISALTKPAEAEAPLPQQAEAAPSPLVEKIELPPALNKFHVAHEDGKETGEKVASFDAIDAPKKPSATKAAEPEKKIGVPSLPAIAKEAPKAETKNAEAKTEEKASNIGSFSMAKNEDEKEEEGFFSSFFGSSDDKEEAKAEEKPKAADIPAAAAPKTEIKPDVKAPEVKAAAKAEAKTELPKIETAKVVPAKEPEIPASIKAREVKDLPVIAAAPKPAAPAVESPAKPAAQQVAIETDNPLIVPTNKVRREANTNPLKLTDNESAKQKTMELAADKEGTSGNPLIAPRNAAVVAAPKVEAKKGLTKEDVKKLPILATSAKPAELPKMQVEKNEIAQIEAAGKTKETVILEAKPTKKKELPVIESKSVKVEEPKAEPKIEAKKPEPKIEVAQEIKAEVKPEPKKASDILKPLPDLRTSPSAQTTTAAQSSPAKLEEPRISLPKPTPGIEKAQAAELATPHNLMRTEPVQQKVAEVKTPEVMTAVKPQPQILAAAPQPAPAPVAQAPALQIPLVAPKPVAPVVTAPAPVVAAAPAYQPAPQPPVQVAQPAPQYNYQQPAFQPAPVAPAPQAQYSAPAPQQTYIASNAPVTPVTAPAAPVYPRSNNSVVVTKKSSQQQIAYQPAPAAPVAMAPQYITPAPQQTYIQPQQAAQAPVAQPAPIPQAPFATATPNPFLAPNQVVVSKPATAQYTPAKQPGYLDLQPIQQNPLMASNNYVAPQAVSTYYEQPQQQMQYSAPIADKPIGGKELWVNVGYFTTQSAARGFWNRVSANNPEILPKFRMKTKRPAGNAERVTAEIGPIYSSNEANSVCNIISSEGLSCEVNSGLRQAGSTDKYRNFISGQRHSDLSSASGDYGVVGDEASSSSYNSWSIQLGTFDSKDAARNTWESLREQNRVLNRMDPTIDSKDAASRLRLRAGKFSSTEAAQSVCEELRRNFVSCIIVRSS